MGSAMCEYFLITYACREEHVEFVLSFLESVLRVSAICVENSKQVNKSQDELIAIKQFFTFGLSFFFTMAKQFG